MTANFMNINIGKKLDGSGIIIVILAPHADAGGWWVRADDGGWVEYVADVMVLTVIS